MVMTIPVGVITGDKHKMPLSHVRRITKSIRRRGYLKTVEEGLVTNAWIRGVGGGPKLAFSLLIFGYLSSLKKDSTLLSWR